MANKFEQKYKKAVSEFSAFCSVLSKYNYCFIGYFANLAFSHFRASSYFMVNISCNDVEAFRRDLKQCGYSYSDDEFYGDYVLVKYNIVDDIYFSNRLTKKASIEGFNCVVFFPDYACHKEFMLKHNSVYSVEDIEMIESKNPRVNCRDVSFEDSLSLFLQLLVSSKDDHNHSNGSKSCELCGLEMF